MSAVDLADVKAHLRVSFDSEDTYIQSLIDAAESYVDSLGVALDATPPDAVLHAIKLMVGHWYQNREAATTEPPKAIAFGVGTLLAPFREVNL
ncbi:head-tail connector protein [Bradyrhizobium ottawaense]|uniref:head-tail connector protein n=1 Tax=Bradyrhizobium ottawaense TaxID=931866 RepID=UPI0030F44D21